MLKSKLTFVLEFTLSAELEEPKRAFQRRESAYNEMDHMIPSPCAKLGLRVVSRFVYWIYSLTYIKNEVIERNNIFELNIVMLYGERFVFTHLPKSKRARRANLDVLGVVGLAS